MPSYEQSHIHTAIAHTPIPALSQILALRLNKLSVQGIGGLISSPTLLVAPLYEHPGVRQYSARAHSAGRTAPWLEPG